MNPTNKLAAAALPAFAPLAPAPKYRDNPTRLISPFSAGSAADFVWNNTNPTVPAGVGTRYVISGEASKLRTFGLGNDQGSSLRWNDGGAATSCESAANCAMYV